MSNERKKAPPMLIKVGKVAQDEKGEIVQVEGTTKIREVEQSLKTQFLFSSFLIMRDRADIFPSHMLHNVSDEGFSALYSLIEKHIEEIEYEYLEDGFIFHLSAKKETSDEEISEIRKYSEELDLVQKFVAQFHIEPSIKALEDLEQQKKELEEEQTDLLKEKKRLEKEKKEFSKQKKGNYKKAGHLADQSLKYYYPKDSAPSLFSAIKHEDIKKMEVKEVEKNTAFEGIKLTPSETKLIDCFCKILHHKSQTADPSQKDYFTGNLLPVSTEYGKKQDVSPQLGFTLYELTKEYKGGNAVTGKDVQNVEKIMQTLHDKKFKLKYTEKTKGTKGEYIKRSINEHINLFRVLETSLEYGVNDIEYYKTNEVIIYLHPIFRSQIDSKFILYPNDINNRTIQAYGSHNISEITLRLRDYLLRELSSKRYERSIMLDRLYYIVAEKWMKEHRKKKVQEYTKKAIHVVKELGLLESYKIVESKTTGEKKIVFKINKNFE